MNKTPIFPIAEPQHFSDYGFDLQISYFQVLEEARRHAKRGQGRDQDRKPSLDSVHLKLQKPTESSCSKRIKRRHHHLRRASAGKWLRSAGSALLFWKRGRKEKEKESNHHSRSRSRHSYSYSASSCSYPSCYASSYSASGPLYMTENHSRAEAVTCRAKSGPLAGRGGPYFNLRELNLVSGAQSGSAADAAMPMPVYLVT